MSAGPAAPDCADPIVIPFIMTIPAPPAHRQDGMSRFEPVLVHPASGWPDRINPGPKPPSFSIANLLGIATARAQELPPEEEEEITRRGAGGQSRTDAEEFRLELYNVATRRLRELEPSNPELAGLSTQDYIPGDAALSRRQEALREAEARASNPAASNRDPNLAENPDEIRVGPRVTAREALRTLPLSKAVQLSIEEAAFAKTPEEQLQSLATPAVRYGEGRNARTFGIDSHYILRRAIKELHNQGSRLDSEVSYRGGEIVKEGDKGSIRVDALIGTAKAPEAIYDLKTGNRGLDLARIRDIRAQLPPGFEEIPVIELRP